MIEQQKYSEELEVWMTAHETFSPALDDTETESLKKRILSKKISGRHPVRMFLVLAAVMCLLAACGAAAVGLFDSMAETNRTEDLVEAYGLTLDDPPSLTADGRTLTVQSIIRSDTTARIIYDVTGNSRQVTSWSTIRQEDGTILLRTQFLSGQTPYDENGAYTHQNLLRQSGHMGKTEDGHAIRCFADIDIPEGTEHVDLFLLSEEHEAESLTLELPEPIPDLQAKLPDAPVTFSPPDKNGSDVDAVICRIQVTPFRLVLEGTFLSPVDSLQGTGLEWENQITLYDAHGQEILVGKDGSYYSGGGSLGSQEQPDFQIELNSYDLIDPAEVYEAEIGGIRYILR